MSTSLNNSVIMSVDPLSIACNFAFLGASKEVVSIVLSMKSANKEEQTMIEKLIEDETSEGTITSSLTFKELATSLEKTRSSLQAFIDRFAVAQSFRMKRFKRSSLTFEEGQASGPACSDQEL
ncbi:hypothetical protein M422DRAFT_272557 [Sphaerobolus stellatus SS14]|uniref:Uncharacterized protein n=1 Tax=Sphaerobolus stellatus (strain SS14) TaxID=990650 RepID=A0A0C9UBD6_SPHS4|nr:hypothetical protein M422DRAFT_272557 [Sphaerobolus stellatus SS14]